MLPTTPKRACLHMRECPIVEGIVWVWMGENGKSTVDLPIQGDGLHDIYATTGKHPNSKLMIFNVTCHMSGPTSPRTYLIQY